MKLQSLFSSKVHFHPIMYLTKKKTYILYYQFVPDRPMLFCTFSRHINYVLIELIRVQKRSIKYQMTYGRVQNHRPLSTKWPQNSEYKMTSKPIPQVPIYFSLIVKQVIFAYVNNNRISSWNQPVLKQWVVFYHGHNTSLWWGSTSMACLRVRSTTSLIGLVG